MGGARALRVQAGASLGSWVPQPCKGPVGGPGVRETDATRLLPPRESWGGDAVGVGGMCIAGSRTQGSERGCWAQNDIPDRGTVWQGEGGEKAIWLGVAAFIMNHNICISNHS